MPLAAVAVPGCRWTRPPVPTELISVLILHTGSVQQEQESSPKAKRILSKWSQPWKPNSYFVPSIKARTDWYFSEDHKFSQGGRHTTALQKELVALSVGRWSVAVCVECVRIRLLKEELLFGRILRDSFQHPTYWSLLWELMLCYILLLVFGSAWFSDSCSGWSLNHENAPPVTLVSQAYFLLVFRRRDEACDIQRNIMLEVTLLHQLWSVFFLCL